MAETDNTGRKPLTDADIQAISERLSRAAYSLLAVHKLASEAQEDESGFHLVAIKELARTTFRGLDACIVRLDASPGIGNFASEFDEEEEVANG